MANPNIWAPGESISANSSVAVERFVATAGQTLFTLTAFTYSVGTSSLYVYVNGGFQVVAVDFTETSSSSFTLSEAVTEGSIVAAVGFLEIAGGSSVVDAAVVAAQAAKAAAELAETSAEASAVAAATSANNLPNAATAGASKYLKTNATSDGWEYKPAADVLADIVPELHAADEKTTPVNDDEFAIVDSSDSYTLKKFKWSSLVTAVTSALSTVYATFAQGAKADTALQPEDIGVDVLGYVAPGTSGNVLTSNGSAWTSAASASASASGCVFFTASGSWTVPTRITSAKVTVIGGGGKAGNATGDNSATGGGGAGGCAIKRITGLTPGASITVTVGAAGGTSSFGAYCSATGGSASLNVTSIHSYGSGGAGGSGTGGDINISGQSGGGGFGDGANGHHLGGTGGSTRYGSGGASVTNGHGKAATGYGAGGGGAATNSGDDYTGGNGAPGIVVIEW